MPDVLVAIGDHGPAPIPPAAADDVHLGREERVGVTHHGADIEVMLPILDRHVETVPAPVEVGHDGLAAPVPVAIDDIAAVAMRQKLGVVLLVGRPFAHPRSDTDHCFIHGRLR